MKQWKILRSFSDRVLGGCAYVWTTGGPEPLDRAFGLTNEDGEPVDGVFLALAAAFQEDAQATANAVIP